jgi:hypothetical protein
MGSSLRLAQWWFAVVCAGLTVPAHGQRILADGFEGTDLRFVVPHLAAPVVQAGEALIDTRLRAIDLYVIVDRSGSMSAEITAVRNNLSTVVSNLRCPPAGTGQPNTCIPDLWAGAGTVGYAGSGVDAYRHYADLQPNANFSSLPVTEPGGCCAEPLVFSVYAAITGTGGATFGFTGVPARASCTGSPAANAGHGTFGYPCFRQGVLPLLVLATDEQPLSSGDTNKVPNWASIVRPAMLERGGRLIGVTGSGFAPNTDVDLRVMATDTGAVDGSNANAPLVFDGAGTNAAAAIQAGVQAAANGLPLRMTAVLQDDAADAVDAVAAFVDRIETAAGPGCTPGLATEDGDGDGFADLYPAAPAGAVACWRVVPKVNATVPATGAVQVFRATLQVDADAAIALGRRDVYFVVPASP